MHDASPVCDVGHTAFLGSRFRCSSHFSHSFRYKYFNYMADTFLREWLQHACLVPWYLIAVLLCWWDHAYFTTQLFLCQSSCPHCGVFSKAAKETLLYVFIVLYHSFNSFLLFLSFNFFSAESRRAQQQSAFKQCPTKPKGSSWEKECLPQN